MIVLDASVWVSFALPRDVNHAVSLHWVRQYLVGGGQIIAPSLLAVEVGGAVTRRTGQFVDARRAVAILLRLPAMRWVTMNNRMIAMATRLAIDLRLRGADAVYVAVAAQFNIPLITWDQEQIARAGTRFAVRPPAAP